MFKLTYQTFVMTYTVSGFVAVRIITSLSQTLKGAAALFFAIVFSLILIYPTNAIGTYYGSLKTYKGLAGNTWLATRHPNEYAAVQWFQENVKGQTVILEASGDSYTDYNVISAYTGLSSVSGWFVHEWLWRGDSSFPQARVNDISTLYTSNDTKLVSELLNKYGVKYVVVGTFEREKYPDLQEKVFGEVGEIVFTSGNTRVYRVISK